MSAGKRVQRLYVASSWRNELQPGVVQSLRAEGFHVYDFRHPAPGNDGFAWSEIDPAWQAWTQEHFRSALEHPIAVKGFSLDFGAMKDSDACVLVLPSGRSAHLEAGWFVGNGRPCFVLQTGPLEPELMYAMVTAICVSIEEVIAGLRFEFGLDEVQS